MRRLGQKGQGKVTDAMRDTIEDGYQRVEYLVVIVIVIVIVMVVMWRW